jgi:hypothetical protein
MMGSQTPYNLQLGIPKSHNHRMGIPGTTYHLIIDPPKPHIIL